VPVPDNVHAQLVPQSLIGERYVQLFPAWKEGQPQAEDGHEIGKDAAHADEVIIPVEPDEALAALDKFLKALDPKGLGQLITNLSDDLKGNGAKLNHALDSVSQLVATFADKDQQLLDIVDSFDKLTTTLRTRETQLGDVIQTFSQASQVLADERQNLQLLLASLSSLSENALALVVKHSDRLHTDIEELTQLAQSIDANLGSVGKLLASGPMIANGLINAYDPVTHSTNLRTQLGPILANLLDPTLLGLLGLPPLRCIPIDTACPAAIAAPSVAGQAASSATALSVPRATTPVDDLLALLGAPTAKRPPSPSTSDRVADGATSVGGFFADAAAALVGAS